jgi:hypothetical protein
MKNWHWLPVGIAVGLGCGALFGFDYALAGGAIGLAGGLAIALSLRRPR